jgi:hypothetical protein
VAYLLLGLVLSAAQQADMWLGFNPLIYTSTSVIVQVLLVGWLSQAVIGLLYGGTVASPRVATAAWGCFNLGLVAAIVGQPLLALTGSELAGGLLAAGGLLQLAGGVLSIADLAPVLLAWDKSTTRTPKHDGDDAAG